MAGSLLDSGPHEEVALAHAAAETCVGGQRGALTMATEWTNGIPIGPTVVALPVLRSRRYNIGSWTQLVANSVPAESKVIPITVGAPEMLDSGVARPVVGSIR